MLKQKKTNKYWGYFMQIIQQESVVINSFTMIFSLIAAGGVMQIRGYEVPIWALLVIVAIGVIVGGIVIWTKGMPSYFSAFNDQFAKHDNPILQRMDKYEKNQKKIMEKLGIKYED